jgi:CheY-like chemotaxis protein
MSAAPQQSVLVIDDDDGVRSLIGDIAESCGCLVRAYADGSLALESAAASPPDVLVLDLMMPGMDGIEVLHRLRDIGCRSRIIMASGAEARLLDSATRLGRAIGLDVVSLAKPFPIDRLTALLTKPEASGTACSR